MGKEPIQVWPSWGNDKWSDPDAGSERIAPGPSNAATCSPSSLTPETDAIIAADQHHLEDDNFFPATVYWRMCDVARTLERERDEWRKKAVDLHARYKGALEDIETEIADRNEARRIAKEACELLDREGYQVNYPQMPWEPDSPEFVERDSPENEKCPSTGATGNDHE